jgi:hypothetical protein
VVKWFCILPLFINFYHLRKKQLPLDHSERYRMTLNKYTSEYDDDQREARYELNFQVKHAYVAYKHLFYEGYYEPKVIEKATILYAKLENFARIMKYDYSLKGIKKCTTRRATTKGRSAYLSSEKFDPKIEPRHVSTRY